MKALFAALVMTLSFSQAFADGYITCTAIDPDNGQRDDIMALEADIAFILTEKGDDGVLSYIGEKNGVRNFSNSKVQVIMNNNDHTVTVIQRATGASKVHTELKCVGSGDDIE
ncbi:hypothetical protein [Bdellovibrio reynosensis]|uniref:Uncharacterized protein n=1 Tax=Bdellovibrio reynosensis TaxID=2835041 RepID=A0ABY4CC40_9BACT|nr:hypothetical protein [Bdellovibrio reynosensis]UOF02541.1 hypothetical protein MNR06_06195 [Bdellovibrio reynosensis]